MTNIHWPAVRAWRRASRTMYEEQAIADHMDALYDGGEWSLPARAKLNVCAERALAQKIGREFGLSAEALLDQVWCAAHIEDDRHMAQLMMNAI